MTSRIAEPTAVDSQADGWARALDTQQSEEARTEFTEWVLQSPDHLRAYLERQALATELAAVDPDRQIDVEALICELKARQQTAEAPKSCKPRFLPVVIPRASFRKALASYTRLPLTTWIARSAGIVLFGLLAYETQFHTSHERTAKEQIKTGYYTTALGEQKCENLPDSSKVCLNSASKIRYAYTGTTRNIELVSGEATFEVHHGSTRPFNVLSGRSVIQDIGTSFDVYIKPGSTVVTVIEGQIRILSPINAASNLNIDLRQHTFGSAGNDVIAPELHELQQVELSRTTGAMRMLPTLTDRRLSQLLAWRQGRIDLTDMRLGDALEQFSRYHIERFEFADEALSRTRVGGSVDCAHLDDFLSLLEIEFGIHHKTTTGADGIPVITLWRPRGKSHN